MAKANSLPSPTQEGTRLAVPYGYNGTPQAIPPSYGTYQGIAQPAGPMPPAYAPQRLAPTVQVTEASESSIREELRRIGAMNIDPALPPSTHVKSRRTGAIFVWHLTYAAQPSEYVNCDASGNEDPQAWMNFNARLPEDPDLVPVAIKEARARGIPDTQVVFGRPLPPAQVNYGQGQELGPGNVRGLSPYSPMPQPVLKPVAEPPAQGQPVVYK